MERKQKENPAASLENWAYSGLDDILRHCGSIKNTEEQVIILKEALRFAYHHISTQNELLSTLILSIGNRAKDYQQQFAPIVQPPVCYCSHLIPQNQFETEFLSSKTIHNSQNHPNFHKSNEIPNDSHIFPHEQQRKLQVRGHNNHRQHIHL